VTRVLLAAALTVSMLHAHSLQAYGRVGASALGPARVLRGL
jgi:hypothetical protein